MRTIRSQQLATKRSSLVAAFIGLLFSAAPALALVRLNDGRDKIFVTGSVAMGWDSNVYANKEGKQDYVMSASVGADYTRRAGLIGVDASVMMNASKYNTFSSEDFKNPKFNVEFTKQVGRTTGSLTLSAARASRADPAANMRTTSWNYGSSLSLHYPVIQRYSLTGGVNVSKNDYANNDVLVDLSSYGANIDLLYMYSSQRDIFVGYRWRRDNTSISDYSIDHAFTAGAKGRIFARLNGSVRAGYQLRQSHGINYEVFESWTSSGSLTYNFSKRTTFTGTLAKDFTTSSTNVSTDGLTGNLSVSFAWNARWSLGGNVGYGETEFLGVAGEGRKDTHFNWGADINYSMNDHFKASFSYSYLKNWSSLSYADYTRSGYSLSMSTRW